MYTFHDFTTLRPAIPQACITPLQDWFISQMFEVRHLDEDGCLYFSSNASLIESWDIKDPVFISLLASDRTSFGERITRLIEQFPLAETWSAEHIEYDEIFQSICSNFPARIPFLVIQDNRVIETCTGFEVLNLVEIFTENDACCIASDRQVLHLIGDERGVTCPPALVGKNIPFPKSWS